MDGFVERARENQQLLNVDKTREVVSEFREKGKALQPLCMLGKDVERVEDCRCLGVYILSRLNWKTDSTALCKNNLSQLYFLRKLRSFNTLN